MKCTNCNDTGDTGSGYLDCTKCGAADDRAALNKLAGFDLTEIEWRFYQLGKESVLKQLKEVK